MKPPQKKSPSVRQRTNDIVLGFHGGSAVKNPPARTGETGSIPDPGRSPMSRNNSAHESQLLSLWSRAREPQLLRSTHREPVLCNERSPHTTIREQPPLAAPGEKTTQQPRPGTAKGK